MTRLGRFYEWVVEIGWLLAIAATPMYFNVYSSRVFEPDKATVLRSVVLLAAAAFLLGWIERRSSKERGSLPERSSPEPSGGAAGQWRRPFTIAALVFATLQIIATVTSIAPSISWWGSYMRLQGGYTFLAYFTLFLIMMASLRRREQVDRLVTVALLVSVPVSFYGIVQFLHLDPLPWGGDVTTRVTSSLGNAIFLAAYLIMAVPLALFRWVEAYSRYRQERATPAAERPAWTAAMPRLAERAGLVLLMNVLPAALVILNMRSANTWWGALPALACFVLLALPFTVTNGTGSRQPRALPAAAGLAAYTLLLAGQLAAIVLTQSRGPWIGIAAGLVCFVVLLALRGRRRRLLQGALTVAIPAALLLVIVNLPIAQLDAFRQLPYVGRLGTLTDIRDGTGKVRALIWQGSLELLRERPAPGLGSDSLAALRPFLGYGPDVMALASNKVYQPGLAQLEARNASPDRNHMGLLDHLVMTGLFGLLAYLAVVVTGLRQGWQHLWKADRPRDQLLLIGIISALVAHLVESQVGIVIVATWTYFWVYLAVIARAPVWMEPEEAESIPVQAAAPAAALAAAAVLNASRPAAAVVASTTTGAAARRRKARRAGSDTPGLPGSSAAASRMLRSGEEAGSLSWLWVGIYVALSILAILALLGARPIEDARSSLILSYAWAAAGILAGALFLGGSDARRVLPFASGGVAPLIVTLVAFVIVSWITVFNLDVVTADVYYKRGSSAEAAGRLESAIPAYQKAIALEPEQDWYYIFFGRALLGMAETRGPRQGGALNARTVDQLLFTPYTTLAAMAKDELLDYPRVLFERAARINPLNPDHYANLGRLHRYWGESLDRSHLEESVVYLQEATTISPRTAHLQNELARTYLSLGDVDAALRVLDRSLQLDPTFASTYALQGYAYQQAQRWDEALAAHARAMEMDPNSITEVGAEQRLIKYIEAGKGAELEEAARRMVERHPGSPVARSTYGFVLSRLGKVREALVQYQANADMSPRDWVAHRNVAISYQQLGMINEAVAAAQLSLQFAPENQKKPIQDFMASLQAARKP